MTTPKKAAKQIVKDKKQELRLTKRSGLYVPGKAGIQKAPKDQQKPFKQSIKKQIRSL